MLLRRRGCESHRIASKSPFAPLSEEAICRCRVVNYHTCRLTYKYEEDERCQDSRTSFTAVVAGSETKSFA